MASARDFFRSIAIMLFAAGIVAVGAQELYQQYGKSRTSRSLERQGEWILENLVGEDLRARMAPGSPDLEQPGKASSRSSMGDEGVRAPDEAPTSQRDALSKKDRQELDSLLNSVLQ